MRATLQPRADATTAQKDHNCSLSGKVTDCNCCVEIRVGIRSITKPKKVKEANCGANGRFSPLAYAPAPGWHEASAHESYEYPVRSIPSMMVGFDSWQQQNTDAQKKRFCASNPQTFRIMTVFNRQNTLSGTKTMSPGYTMTLLRSPCRMALSEMINLTLSHPPLE